MTNLDPYKTRADFPILHQDINGKPLVYFDNGASSQKPKVVIDAVSNYYSKSHANVHRGVHTLSQEATNMYEDARRKLKTFVNARFEEEIVFTSGTTQSINLLAFSIGEKYIQKGDEILITEMEHHSNIVPWQMLCERKGATLKVAPIFDNGELNVDAFKQLLSYKTKLAAFIHVSNTLGTVNPVKELINACNANGTKVFIDGAQSAPHLKIDVQDLNCDFYAFSGHKLCGPTGIGIIYGRKDLLEEMPPYQGGGEMIKTVTFEKTTYNELPHKFEAGTPNIAGVIGLGVAIDYINNLGLLNIEKYENELLQYATKQLIENIPEIKIYGNAKHKASLISFLIGNHHPYDVGALLDQMGIAVRTGHHCTEPLMSRYGIPGTIRASFSFYNTKEEIDKMISGLQKALNILS